MSTNMTFTVYTANGGKEEKPFEVGQVWREYMDQDYGDILRWKVTAVGRNVAVVTNQATLKERTILRDAISTFTFQCELLPATLKAGNKVNYTSYGEAKQGTIARVSDDGKIVHLEGGKWLHVQSATLAD